MPIHFKNIQVKPKLHSLQILFMFVDLDNKWPKPSDIMRSKIVMQILRQLRLSWRRACHQSSQNTLSSGVETYLPIDIWWIFCLLKRWNSNVPRNGPVIEMKIIAKIERIAAAHFKIRICTDTNIENMHLCHS